MSDLVDGTRDQTPEEVRGLPSAPRPDAGPVRDNRTAAEPASPGRRYVAMAMGSVVAVALVAALVVALLPSGKPSDPSHGSVRNEP